MVNPAATVDKQMFKSVSISTMSAYKIVPPTRQYPNDRSTAKVASSTTWGYPRKITLAATAVLMLEWVFVIIPFLHLISFGVPYAVISSIYGSHSPCLKQRP